MRTNQLKQQEVRVKKQFSTNVTNPLSTGYQEYNELHRMANIKLIADRVMFAVLGAAAVWAFYSALTSLML